MSKWEYKKIGSLVDVRRGASPRPIQQFLQEVGTPWVKISDATCNDSRFITSTEQYIKEDGESKSVIVNPGDLIVSNSATPGLPKIMKIRACIHDGWLFVTNYKNITRDFLYYSIKYHRHRLINQGSGSIFTNLKTEILKDFEIPLPSIEEQEKITKVLKSIEDKIELNNKINAKLKALAKTIYDYWFLQFEFPNEKGQPYKSSGGKMVWNDVLKKEIPEGWQNDKIIKLGEIVSGGTPRTDNPEYYCKEGIAWITPDDLSNSSNKYISHGLRDISKVGLENSSAKLMPKGSVLISTRAPIGYLAIALNEVTTNQGFKSIIPKDEFGSEYVYYTINSNIKVIEKKGTGTTFKEVSKDTLSNINILFPNKDIIKKFTDFMKPISEKMILLQKENNDLVKLRDFLLPMLMNGQVTFKSEEELKEAN